jgi:hypothetical protein
VIILHKVVILMDGQPRSLMPHSDIEDTLKDIIAPRIRGWHAADGAVILVVSMPANIEGVGRPHVVTRYMRTGADTMSKTSLVIRHHESPSFVSEITKVYLHPSGIVDTKALDSMPGCSLLAHVTEEYSRVHE